MTIPPKQWKGFAKTIMGDIEKALKAKNMVEVLDEHSPSRSVEIQKFIDELMEGATFTLPDFIEKLSHTPAGFDLGKNCKGIRLKHVNENCIELLWLTTGQFAETPNGTLTGQCIKPIDLQTVAFHFGVNKTKNAIINTLHDIHTHYTKRLA